jgi:hypothetical protein
VETKEVEVIDPGLLDAETPGLVKLELSNNYQTAAAWASVRGGPGDWKLIARHTFDGGRMRYWGLAASSSNPGRPVKFYFGITQGPTTFTDQELIGPEVSGQRWDKGIRP